MTSDGSLNDSDCETFFSRTYWNKRLGSELWSIHDRDVLVLSDSKLDNVGKEVSFIDLNGKKNVGTYKTVFA